MAGTANQGCCGLAGAGAADWQNAAVPVERSRARIVSRIAHPFFTDAPLAERVANPWLFLKADSATAFQSW